MLLSGVAVGAGLQTKVAIINLVCFYGIGLPIGAVLGYVFHFQVKVIILLHYYYLVKVPQFNVVMIDSAGNMDWNDNWSYNSDSITQLHDMENKLGSRGQICVLTKHKQTQSETTDALNFTGVDNFSTSRKMVPKIC